MNFELPLIQARLVQRYKRFLADVRLESGEIVTVHCPNPGAMLGLKEPESRCWISDSQNPKRKLRYTLELMEVDAPSGKVMVGINTNHPNKLGVEIIENGLVPSLESYQTLRREVKYGENSRIDILLEHENRPPCYVEIKNVHFVRTKGLHEFPDCKTERGAKHLRELSRMVQLGARAVMLYIIQRDDGDSFSIATDIDSNYATEFTKAREAGVEAFAVKCDISVEKIDASTLVPIVL